MAFPKIEKSLVKVGNQVFGRPISYKLMPEDDTQSIKGIFDNAFIEVNGVSSTYPILNLDLALLPRFPSVKDQIIIESVRYRVLDVRPDGVGGCVLVLQR